MQSSQKTISKSVAHFSLLFMSMFYLTSTWAVNVSQNGYGEAIILPYYTVNNGLNTLITVNNSTDQVKAVKLHFREGKQGKSVLSYNLYLAPNDIWVAGLVPAVSDALNHEGEPTAAIVFGDQSCVPYLNSGQQFLPFEIAADSADSNMQRSTEGYIEVIEMGELDPSFGLGAATVFQSDESNCATVEAAFEVDQVWHESSGDLTAQMLPAQGGLSASVGIIDVAEGTLYSYAGLAFENFYPVDSIFHTSPSDTRVPSLDQADTTSTLINNNEKVSSEWEHGYEAISALLIKQQVVSLYETDPSIAALTELVFTFPTKRFYLTDNNLTKPPFTASHTTANGACEPFKLTVTDRNTENNFCNANPSHPICQGGGVGGVPPVVEPVFNFCYATNVKQLKNGSYDVELQSSLLGSRNDRRYIKSFQSGKMTTEFEQFVQLPASQEQAGYTYFGLPVVGLSFEKYTNANAEPGLLAQYGGVYKAKYKTKIIPN